MTSPSDPQQEQLYEWERAFVEPKVAPEVLSADETRLLIKRVSILLGITEPKVRFTSIPISCKAYPYLNQMEIADWGRTRATILHEMAHFGSWPAVQRGDSPHGRAFTTLAILLYHHFLGLPLDYLEDTARSRNLAFYPAASRPIAAAPAAEDFFPDDF